MVRSRRRFPQRQPARGRTLYADQPVSPELRSHDRGFESVHPSMEDSIPAVSANRAGRTAHGVQVRRVRGRDLVRAFPPAAKEVTGGRRVTPVTDRRTHMRVGYRGTIGAAAIILAVLT